MREKLTENAWKVLRLDATRILSQNGNRLRLILASLILSAFALPCLLLAQACQTILMSGRIPIGFETVTMLLPGIGIFLWTMFVMLPLLGGLFRLAERMEAEEDTALVDVFFAFTDRTAYRTSIVAGLCMAEQIALPVAGAAAFVTVFSDLFKLNLFQWIGIALAAVLGAVALFILFLGGFGRLYRIFRKSGRRNEKGSGGRRIGLWYWGHFLPHLILSVLTVLIYFVADVLPRMLISYFGLWRMLTEPFSTDDVQSEDINK